jgi:hypothetical protein
VKEENNGYTPPWQLTAESLMCRGSYQLGTACGTCKRCKEELANMNKKFKVKAEALGNDVVATFRVKPDVHAKLKELASQSGVTIPDVVRQMIDFALEHS